MRRWAWVNGISEQTLTRTHERRIRTMHRYITWTIVLAVAVMVPFAAAAPPPPTLTWSPATNGSYDYGSVAAGQTASQTFSLTNSGRRATGGLTVTLSGSPAVTITADGCSGRSLGPLKSCTVAVQFAPTASGGVTATLTATGSQAIASLTLAGSSGTVGGHVYWSAANAVTIGRADLDGQNANQNFIASGPADGLAVDSGHVYWADHNNGTIGRADLDANGNVTGVNQSFIAGASNPFGVAVYSGHLYWTEYDGYTGFGTIGRADLNGQNVNHLFITGASFPQGVAVDSGHVYWGNFFAQGQGIDAIGRADLDANGDVASVNQSFISYVSWPAGLAVDSGHLYWASFNTDEIARADLDASGNVTSVSQNFIPAYGPYGVAVDSGHVYWANFYDTTVGRADLNGVPGSVNQSFITGAPGPVGVAVGN
jgi:sugar lactone lactonase YvrE